MLVPRLALIACLVAVAGCGAKRASRDAANTLSPPAAAPTTLAPQAGGTERGALADNRSCNELTSDAEEQIAKMTGLASRRKKALLFVPKTLFGVVKRATGRAESAQELTRKYEQRRATVIAINAALAHKGCATVELPSEPETKEPRSGFLSGRKRY
ncbi:MAG: hypothetical protein OEM91_09375 [Hyphomicrobiales bacterium]|nr:hypothetical protein [Hyphomicrobiales bacterium]